jgi:hypothetical protein
MTPSVRLSVCPFGVQKDPVRLSVFLSVRSGFNKTSDIYASTEDQFRRASHVDVIVGFPPLNLQWSPRQFHPTAALRLAFQHASHHHRTRPCTTRTDPSGLPHRPRRPRPACLSMDRPRRASPIYSGTGTTCLGDFGWHMKFYSLSPREWF